MKPLRLALRTLLPALCPLLLALGASAQTPMQFAAFMAGTNAVAGGGGPASCTDELDGADSDTRTGWTEILGDWDNNNNRLEQQTIGSSCYVIYTGCTFTTVTNYALFTLVSGADSSFLVMRYTDASSPFYLLEFKINADTVAWYHETSISNLTDDVIQGATALTIADLDEFGVTWDATGNNTEIRIWRNPTGNSPTTYANWGGDTTPDVTMTTNPGANAVDVGPSMGFGAYSASTVAAAKFDSVHTGDANP